MLFSCNYNVENSPPYEALSYVWGRNTAGSPMWCDGMAITIASNLDGALRNLRLPTEVRRLWVDAVCIDQQNIEERNRQVQYMRLIYRYVTRAVVWLGLRTTGVKQAFDLAQKIARLRDHAARVFSYNRRVCLTRSGYIGIGPKMMRAGAEVCVLFGGRMPFIVRPMHDHHVFIGDTYLHDHDIMRGNATKSALSQWGHITVETFELR